MIYFDRMRNEAVMAQAKIVSGLDSRYVRMPRIPGRREKKWIEEFLFELRREGVTIPAKTGGNLDVFAASLCDKPRVLDRWLDFKTEKLFNEVTRWVARVRRT